VVRPGTTFEITGSGHTSFFQRPLQVLQPAILKTATAAAGLLSGHNKSKSKKFSIAFYNKNDKEHGLLSSQSIKGR
jgi:hypothetical protein